MYNVLTPIYTKTTDDQWSVSWKIIGVVNSLQEAKERYGSAPVLEVVK